MENVKAEKELFQHIAKLIASQFGPNCEIAVHDLTGDYDHTIAIIENGHVTSRKIGDCGSNLGLEVLRGLTDNGDRYGYITHTPDGKILRSSSIYLRNRKGEVIGAVCINLDISNLVMADRMMEEFYGLDQYKGKTNGDPAKTREVFANDVSHLLDEIIAEALAEIGKPVAMMTREEKIRVVAHLDSRGAFLVSKAGGKVCKQLNISKYTLYSYLETVHSDAPVPASEAAVKAPKKAARAKPAARKAEGKARRKRG